MLGGYTPLIRAQKLFEPATLRTQGTLIGLLHDSILAGFVIHVPSGSPHRKMAQGPQSELRLLAVSPELRGQKLGQALVEKVIQRAQEQGDTSLILWTQWRMQIAQTLYLKMGFNACPTQNFQVEDREFWVYEKNLLFEK